MRYTSDDAMKYFNPTAILKEVQSKPPVSDSDGFTAKKNLAARVCSLLSYLQIIQCPTLMNLVIMWQLDQCRKLVQIADKSLKEGGNYYYGIEACNDVLHGHGQIGHTLMHECLCLRAALLLKVFYKPLPLSNVYSCIIILLIFQRNWKNDAHMAIRDCYRAVEINPNSFRALLCMAEALSQVKSMDYLFKLQV